MRKGGGIENTTKERFRLERRDEIAKTRERKHFPWRGSIKS